MNKICIVAGARPNFIKVAPIIRAIQRRNANGEQVVYSLVYTGKQNDSSVEPSLFEDLQIPMPDTYLNVEENNLNALTGEVMNAFEHYLQREPCDTVIVVDDLASTMAVSIVAKKQGLRLAHLVAGTRSFDINMPKEINRLVIDGLSDFLFTAGEAANNIVFREGVKEDKVYTVGNILIDTLRSNRPRFQKPTMLKELEQERGNDYLVFTLNRKALIQNTTLLYSLIEAIIVGAEGVPVIAPLRKDAKDVMETIIDEIVKKKGADSEVLHKQLKQAIHIVPPMPYLQFGYLTAHAMGIITDSGNVAEEATFNAVPCATLNSYTEHIETVTTGSNILVGEDVQLLETTVGQMIRREWKASSLPDNWDGRSAERIVEILCRDMNKPC